MKNKYKVNEKVKEYVEQAEAKWGTRVVKLRCDNGREYYNEKLKQRKGNFHGFYGAVFTPIKWKS